jgi:hypothetical protein
VGRESILSFVCKYSDENEKGVVYECIINSYSEKPMQLLYVEEACNGLKGKFVANRIGGYEEQVE